jgi:hypothetical protein
VYSGTFAELLLHMNVYLRLPGCISFNREDVTWVHFVYQITMGVAVVS